MLKCIKILLIFLLLIACTPKGVVNQLYGLLDSLINAERILTYDSLLLLDYETKEWFYEYYFIRDSLTLHWIKRGDNIQIIKRIDK